MKEKLLEAEWLDNSIRLIKNPVETEETVNVNFPPLKIIESVVVILSVIQS